MLPFPTTHPRVTLWRPVWLPYCSEALITTASQPINAIDFELRSHTLHSTRVDLSFKNAIAPRFIIENLSKQTCHLERDNQRGLIWAQFTRTSADHVAHQRHFTATVNSIDQMILQAATITNFFAHCRSCNAEAL